MQELTLGQKVTGFQWRGSTWKQLLERDLPVLGIDPVAPKHGRGAAFGARCSCSVAAVPWHVLRHSGELSAAMNV